MFGQGARVDTQATHRVTDERAGIARRVGQGVAAVPGDRLEAAATERPAAGVLDVYPADDASVDGGDHRGGTGEHRVLSGEHELARRARVDDSPLGHRPYPGRAAAVQAAPGPSALTITSSTPGTSARAADTTAA